jgi:hypothetical protein
MIRRTLLLLTFPALLALAACQHTETGSSTDLAPGDMSGWRLSSGKMPTQAEYVALTATCEARGSAMDPCLTELGLKKAP